MVIEIRVEPNAQASGSYEKLRAKELAQAVSLLYPSIIDAAYHLSELGKTPGVMDEDSHRVFTNINREVDGVIMENRYEAMEALLNYWKEPVLASCKRISIRSLSEKSLQVPIKEKTAEYLAHPERDV